MKKKFKNVGMLACLAILFLFISDAFTDYKYNPFTRKLDYYSLDIGAGLGVVAAGDVLFHDGTNWTNLTAGANGLVLTLNAGLPTWIATGAPISGDGILDRLEVNECFTYDAVQTATGDGTTTIDWGLGNVMYFTFGAQNDTFTFTAPPGVAKLTLVLKQDGVGSRIPTWPGTVLWPGNVAPTLSTTAAYVDIITFLWDGTNYFGLFNGDFR